MPPLPRGTPFWYRRYFPSIASKFAESFRHTEEGIFVLPTYSKPDYELDGIHLTEEDGPRYIIYHIVCGVEKIFFFRCRE